MVSRVYRPISKLATTYASVLNAVNFGLLKKLGILKEGNFVFVESLSSDESFNHLTESGQGIYFGFHVEAVANLIGFLDPTNEDYFLTWEMGENSYVTLPGLAENAPIARGTIKLRPMQSVEYHFTFLGNDEKNYFYRGIKNVLDLHQVRAWTTLNGSVHKRETGEKLLESTIFTNGEPALESLFPCWRSVQLR